MPPTPENIPSRGVINVIIGGPIDGDSNRARKSHARLMESLAIGESRGTRKAPLLNFGPKELTGVIFPHSDALVIRTTIANYEVAWVLVDSGSSVNVLFQEAFNRMQLEEAQVEAIAMALFGFIGHAIHSVGQITLPLTLGEMLSRRANMTLFLLVDAPSMYNVILR